MELIDADGTLANHIADDSHTNAELRLNPGVYLSKGHALLVGTNQRNLVVVDLGGVIQVAGIDVIDPDHLDAFADYLRELGQKMRKRRTRVTPERPSPACRGVSVVDRHPDPLVLTSA